jgi:hypothetical protein
MGAVVRKLRNGLTVTTLLALAAWAAPAACASSLPTLLANTKCEQSCTKVVAIYKVRPHTVILAEAYGGNVVVSWSSWTHAAAAGSGTATSSGMGTTTTTPVNVQASRVRNGTFTRLTLTFTPSSGAPSVEVLHLHVGQQDWTT